MTTPIGFTPYKVEVELIKADSDFVATIRTSDSSNFPAGAAVTLKFLTDPVTTWPATVSGATATWGVDKTLVATLLAASAGAAVKATIIYSDGAGVDLEWFSGKVRWHD